MHIREGEVILKIVKRHITPFIFKMLGMVLVAIPLYAILFFIWSATSAEWIFILFAIISFFLGLIITIVALDYLLDKLLITNKRVVWVNWKSLIKKEEREVELADIQDIETREKGVLSKVSIFDYGYIGIETAASTTSIHFEDCVNPDYVRHFILAVMEKTRTPPSH